LRAFWLLFILPRTGQLSIACLVDVGLAPRFTQASANHQNLMRISRTWQYSFVQLSLRVADVEQFWVVSQDKWTEVEAGCLAEDAMDRKYAAHSLIGMYLF
jgi:hypothetical protein